MAHKKTSFIEINGRRYDADTGMALDEAPRQEVTPVLMAPVEPVSRGPKTNRQPAQPTKAHQPQRAQTLMRRSVHKPLKQKSTSIRVHSDTSVLAKVPVITVTPKSSVTQVHQGRLLRARRVNKVR